MGMYCKCNSCGSILEYSLLESPCPFCESELNYKESDSIINYFSIPKLNNPLDYTTLTFNKLPFTNKTENNYLVRNNKTSFHILSIVSISKVINSRNIMRNLSIVWDNNFKNKAYGIMQSVNDSLKFNLKPISYENMFASDNENFSITIFNKIVPENCYERFLRNLDEFSNSYDCSDLFSIYNSINWDLLDSFNDRKKTYYEYAATNYLLHICELIHVPNIDIFGYETKLLSLNTISSGMNFEDSVKSINNIYTANEFINKFVKFEDLSFLEDYDDIENYEDIFDIYSNLEEGAVAPNAIGLNSAAKKASGVYTKLSELGYNPSMQIYSLGETTSLCPTFEKDGMIYYIECNENIMKGINEFESLNDMRDILNEVYNEYDEDNLFITIEGLTTDILKFLLNNSKNNKDFLSGLLNLNNKKREEFYYSNNVYDDAEFKDSIISKFDIKEMNPQNLFKYGKTFYKLRNYQSLAGNQHGFMFIDKNDMVIGYIIIEDKVGNGITIPTVTIIESTSDYKAKGLEMAMINYAKKKLNLNNIRIECRNFMLADKIEQTNEFRKITDVTLPYTLFESINPNINDKVVLNETINATKRKAIEEKVYKTFDILDKTGANTQKYKTLFKSMSDEKFDKYIKELISDEKKNFYLEVLPNKNCPRIKDCKEALDYLKVPTEEYLYYRHDGHKDDPIRTRYKVPILYVNLRRLRVKLNCIREQALVA